VPYYGTAIIMMWCNFPPFFSIPNVISDGLTNSLSTCQLSYHAGEVKSELVRLYAGSPLCDVRSQNSSQGRVEEMGGSVVDSTHGPMVLQWLTVHMVLWFCNGWQYTWSYGSAMVNSTHGSMVLQWLTVHMVLWFCNGWQYTWTYGSAMVNSTHGPMVLQWLTVHMVLWFCNG